MKLLTALIYFYLFALPSAHSAEWAVPYSQYYSAYYAQPQPQYYYYYPQTRQYYYYYAQPPTYNYSYSYRRAEPVYQQSNSYAQPDYQPTYRARSSSGSCSRFLHSDGSLGDWGAAVENAILSSPYKNTYLHGKILGHYCPRFASLSPTYKLKAWVAFWEVLANEESSCGANRETYSPYRQEYGLWQLERSGALRSQNRRGANCANIGSVAGEARCAVAIMGDIQFRRGHPVNWGGSYWGPIRRSSEQILPNMSRFSFCR